ncbi:MAG: TonB family protein [Proteobacteria bacterium]|nr:TonB family protein [Pseudomonadota bacterium]MBU1418484.1 TonB family protein [Pseudomonadota bacterium]MBU1455011.1 TonB family protein [Pseudomonadota bacterium]
MMKRYLQIAPLALLAHGLLLGIRLTPSAPALPQSAPRQILTVQFVSRTPAKTAAPEKPEAATPAMETSPSAESFLPAAKQARSVPPPPVRERLNPVHKRKPTPPPEASARQQRQLEMVDEAAPKELAEPVLQAGTSPVVHTISPLAVHTPPPVYPRHAQRRGLQGKTLLNVLVDSTGKVVQVQVASSSGHAILDQSAVQAVWSWLFRPGSKDGLAAQMWVTVPVRFQLH